MNAWYLLEPGHSTKVCYGKSVENTYLLLTHHATQCPNFFWSIGCISEFIWGAWFTAFIHSTIIKSWGQRLDFWSLLKKVIYLYIRIIQSFLKSRFFQKLLTSLNYMAHKFVFLHLDPLLLDYIAVCICWIQIKG